MPRCFVGLGSHIDRDRMIKRGPFRLKTGVRRVITVSSVYLSPAQGFSGADFYNWVAGFNTEMTVKAVAQSLRAIEFELGRQPDSRKFTPRP